MLLTEERDLPIVTTLTRRVRLLSVDQVARTWWGESTDPRRQAARRLRVLEDAGLVGRVQILAEPLLPLERPLVAWDPGEDEPADYPGLENQLRERWKHPPRTTQVVYATKAAVNAYGGYQAGCLKHPYEATHDLHVSELYLRILRDEPSVAPFWRAEEELPRPRPGDYLPDAAIVGPDGEVRLFIEFAGRYSAERLQNIHRFCKEREYPYVLW